MTLNLLAFDLGAESGRSILGRFDGRRLALSETHRFANEPVRLPGGLHWDVLRLWREILNGLEQTQAAAGSLDALGLDAWGVDFGLLDAHDRLIGNPVHYRDDRTDGMPDEAIRRVPRMEIFRQTGVQFMQINTLYQLLSLARAGEPALDAARTFLTIPDLFNYWLTGVKGCEFTNATTTQCYNPIAQDWARSLLDALGLPTEIFPAIIQPATILGSLSTNATGLNKAASIPIIAPACHDTGSAAAAVPAGKEPFAWISSGTWSIVGVNIPEAITDERALAFNLTNEGGVAGDFRLSKNVMGLWLVQECRRTWAGAGQAWSYDDLTDQAATAVPLKYILDPDDGDFLKPGEMPARLHAYFGRIGQSPPESPGEIVRCVLESIALKYRWVVERLEMLLGHRLETIHIVGGGARNRLLSQATADATGRPVITGPVEATAVGNLVAQAIALRHLASWEEARAVVRASFPVEIYEPRPNAAWDEAYDCLLALLPPHSG
jgi:rhamnulokinase